MHVRLPAGQHGRRLFRTYCSSLLRVPYGGDLERVSGFKRGEKGGERKGGRREGEAVAMRNAIKKRCHNSWVYRSGSRWVCCDRIIFNFTLV